MKERDFKKKTTNSNKKNIDKTRAEIGIWESTTQTKICHFETKNELQNLNISETLSIFTSLLDSSVHLAP